MNAGQYKAELAMSRLVYSYTVELERVLYIF